MAFRSHGRGGFAARLAGVVAHHGISSGSKKTPKILQKPGKIHGFGALRVQNGAKKEAKSKLFGGGKSCKNLVKYRVSGSRTHPKNKPKISVLFFC